MAPARRARICAAEYIGAFHRSRAGRDARCPAWGDGMERVDVFVIGGGGTGSDVTYALAGAGLRVVMAERGVLGGECAHFGCDPTKAMLKSARVAALARRAGEFGV